MALEPTQDPYRRFARYYDEIYRRRVNYRGDVAFLGAVFRKFAAAKPRDLLDLGCGTGSHAVLLARRGYRVTGLDVSPAQLAVARRKARESKLRIQFVHGNMRSFDLGAVFDAAICMFGGFGYLVTDRDVMGCFRSVRRHLQPRGLFVFEFWQSSAAMPAPHRSWLELRGPEHDLIRLDESRFNPHTRLLPVEFRFFVLRGGRVVDRFTETHTIRTYTPAEMRGLLLRGGFDLVGAYGVTNIRKGFRRPRRNDFRIAAVARLKSPRGA